MRDELAPQTVRMCNIFDDSYTIIYHDPLGVYFLVAINLDSSGLCVPHSAKMILHQLDRESVPYIFLYFILLLYLLLNPIKFISVPLLLDDCRPIAFPISSPHILIAPSKAFYNGPLILSPLNRLPSRFLPYPCARILLLSVLQCLLHRSRGSQLLDPRVEHHARATRHQHATDRQSGALAGHGHKCRRSRAGPRHQRCRWQRWMSKGGREVVRDSEHAARSVSSVRASPVLFMSLERRGKVVCTVIT